MPWQPWCHDNQNHEVDGETRLPAFSYHRKWYQFFAMTSSLDKIEDALKKRLQFAFFDTWNESDIRPKRGNSKHVTVLLPKHCIFCRKNKYKNKVLEKLVKCVDDRASNFIIDAAKSSDNFYRKWLADQDLIAREVHYHTSFYKIFPKLQKVPSHNDPYKEAGQLAFTGLLRKCYELNLKPKITYLQILLESWRTPCYQKI